MPQLLKIDNNAASEVARLRKFPDKLRDVIKLSIIDILDLARQRVVQQIVPHGARFAGSGKMILIQTPGATIRRRSKKSGIPYGPPVFNKLRIISRTGDFAKVFENSTSDLVMDVQESGEDFIGSFGIQGAQESKAAGNEFGPRARKPVWKALQYASKRMETVMAMHARNMEAAFNG